MRDGKNKISVIRCLVFSQMTQVTKDNLKKNTIQVTWDGGLFLKRWKKEYTKKKEGSS